MLNIGDLTGEDKVIITAIAAIAILVLGAVIVSVFAPTVNTIITSITPAAITAISILAARHPPVGTAPATPQDVEKAQSRDQQPADGDKPL